MGKINRRNERNEMEDESGLAVIFNGDCAKVVRALTLRGANFTCGFGRGCAANELITPGNKAHEQQTSLP